MSDALSPQTEQYIADALQQGRFASRTELLEAAVVQLREESQSLAALQTPEEVQESLRLCDEAIDEIEAGKGIPWDADETKRIIREMLDAKRNAS